MQPTVQMRDVWRVEDLDGLDAEDWRRYEILDGALVVSPPPGVSHEIATEEVRSAIRTAAVGDLMVLGPVGIEFGSRSYRVPDLVVVSRTNARARRTVLRPPDVVLVVEVVSRGSVTTDRITKPAQYAAAGIAHYWRVETDPVSLSAYELPEEGTTYQLAGTWSGDEIARIERPFPVTVELARLVP